MKSSYIVAVSGGIDSVVLLDMLARDKRYEIIVAHADHGIRQTSGDDAAFVQGLARQYGLKYVATRLELGAAASEDAARQARYIWLQQVMQSHYADAIVTAHHQDDVIETMLINLVRGTGWRGLCSLREHPEIKRPLLEKSRAEIVQYALEHQLVWRDDETNDDVRYLRNYIRYRFVQRLTPRDRAAWVALYRDQLRLEREITPLVSKLLATIQADNRLNRYALIMSDETVFGEIMRQVIGRPVTTAALSRLRHFVCTARSGKRYSQKEFTLHMLSRELIVSTSDVC